MVGTMNRSMAAMSGAWLRRKVFHPWLGGLRRLTMYLATLDCATSNPSLSSSPWMRGAPQSGFSLRAHLPDQRTQFRLDRRSPSPSTRLPTPIATKAGPMPTYQRFGSNNHENRKDRREPAIELNEEPAVVVREMSVALQPAPQDNQLMSKHRVLSLKPQLRPEWRGQDGQSEAEQPDHSASL